MEPDLAVLAAEGVYRLRRADYDRLVATGALEGQQVELLHGVIVPMSPQGPPHAAVIRRLNRWLTPALLGRAEVNVQAPFATADSEPEPDLSVVTLGGDDDRHPTEAYLVVEVSVTSQRRDRGIKADLYASAGVPEYWVIDLATRSVLVHLDPCDGRYTSLHTRRDGDTLVVAAFPDLTLPVAEVLPRP
ncbi:MAG: Uma2 family endonuclease [Myxococcota bacterium]